MADVAMEMRAKSLFSTPELTKREPQKRVARAQK
jgi:hypothetical protein